jgi:threonylcarbamoyladenosine tRNA methylthiotransferase MtaB
LDKTAGIERFRISSIEPNLLTEEIVQFVSNSERFVPHFHIPLQSGNNKQLREMRRRYKRELYSERVDIIRKNMPHACIGVDVIVGFPGETDEDFLETYHFINNMDVSYLHVFTYSERANTDAAEMKGVVPVNIRRDRNEMLRILSEKKRRNFYEKHLETERPVLFEAKNQEGKMFGFTDNYIKVAVDFDEKLINKISEVRLTTIDYIDEEVVVLSVLR